jgi:hypothetical protein
VGVYVVCVGWLPIELGARGERLQRNGRRSHIGSFSDDADAEYALFRELSGDHRLSGAELNGAVYESLYACCRECSVSILIVFFFFPECVEEVKK